jgi:ABC-type dipeptide/oligopeptide/nickel transport systems, permease components
MKQSINFKIGFIITTVMLLVTVVGYFYTPYDPEAMNGLNKFAAPTLKHLMGTDNFGRDIFSRALRGCSNTFFVAFVAVMIGAALGTLIGAFTGYVGGWLDQVFMRVTDIITAFPNVLLAMVFIGFLGTGKNNVILALIIALIPSYSRIIRGEYIYYRNQDFSKSAKLYGAKKLRIMFVHIFPNIIPVLLSSLMIGINNAILAEAGMSYLGIGVQPPEPSLGRMLSEAQAYLFTVPWFAIFPGALIILLVIGLNLLSDGLKERYGRR